MNKIGELCYRCCKPKESVGGEEKAKIKGVAIVQHKDVLGFNDFHVSWLRDTINSLTCRSISIHLLSSHKLDHDKHEPLKGKPAYLHRIQNTNEESLENGESLYHAEFDWESSFGHPGAFVINNTHSNEFFLKSFRLEMTGGVKVEFNCYSWVYNQSKYKTPRVFFSNQSYLPLQTPPSLITVRNRELCTLRGDGKGERKYWDRIYDYDVYNDLGDPDKGDDYRRPVLGGSQNFPYPRRVRTGRPPTKTDKNSESRLFLLDLDIYVPRDDRFGHLKMSDFLAYAFKSITQFLVPALKSRFDDTPNEFDTIEDVMKLYTDGISLPALNVQDSKLLPEFIKQIFRVDGDKPLSYPLPQVVSYDPHAWKTDEEFARETLAGVNPLVITLLRQFPPESKLDPIIYGPSKSSITFEHIERFLDGLTVEQAMGERRLFIVDNHESLMPYVNRINTQDVKIYATRTILFLKDDKTLRPVAIELSLPYNNVQSAEAIRRVVTPATEASGVDGTLWLLAKAYASVTDSGQHQLISHWLRTHAVTEPFAIAMNRNLSTMHPVHKLLKPHFRDTMNINAFARHTLINAHGILEKTVFPGKYAMEMSAVVYKHWRFDEQALPADLLKRGMAEKDGKGGLKLLVEDYPYAKDGLEIWGAIENWVKEYVSLYYENDEAVKSDTEIQAWWSEIKNEGHGDKKDEDWWYKMESKEELESALTIMIWVASAMHAALNFGQYAYNGFVPCRPPLSRRLLPVEGTKEWDDMIVNGNPESALLKTIANQFQTTLAMALIEILSMHATDEVYLGQREDSDTWTSDDRGHHAFQHFADRLKRIENNIVVRNQDPSLKNRTGPVKVDYTLLYPSTSDTSHVGGLTGRGIPNSISI